MKFLPLFLDLTRGHVILVGASVPARTKLQFLRTRGACIRWFPMSVADSEGWSSMVPEGDGTVEIIGGEPGEHDFSGAIAMIAAAGGETDARIALEARKYGIPVNVVDRPDLSTFISPAVVDRGDVVIAISTGGAAPVLARRLRERIEAMLPARIGELATFLGQLRVRMHGRIGSGIAVRKFWERVVDGPVADAVLQGRAHETEALLSTIAESGELNIGQKLGSVAIVGAGPGDPDLLTLKALQALQNADVVLFDELVTVEILDRARRDATKVFVGKRKGNPGEGQDAINRRLIDAAGKGLRVVRLKGGDPFVFGRGGEELEALRAAKIPVSIVPGITASLGCAAESEIPLTFRREATRVVFLTAHCAQTGAAIDWTGLNDPTTTLVIYMGLSSAAAIRDGLIGADADPRTPVAVLARGTRADSRAEVGRLEDLDALAAQVGDGPALLVIGNVVARSKPWRTAQLPQTKRRVLEAV